MTPELWIAIGVALATQLGVLVALWQKHLAEMRAQRQQREQWARAEWWVRVQWAMEQARENDPLAREAGLWVLRGMATSDLATHEEREIIVQFVIAYLRITGTSLDT